VSSGEAKEGAKHLRRKKPNTLTVHLHLNI